MTTLTYTSDPAYIPRGTPLDWAWVGDDAELLLLALEITTRDAIANRHGLGVLQAHYAKAAERLGEVA